MRKIIALAVWTTVTLAIVLAFIAYDTPYDDTCHCGSHGACCVSAD